MGPGEPANRGGGGAGFHSVGNWTPPVAGCRWWARSCELCLLRAFNEPTTPSGAGCDTLMDRPVPRSPTRFRFWSDSFLTD